VSQDDRYKPGLDAEGGADFFQPRRQIMPQKEGKSVAGNTPGFKLAEAVLDSGRHG
jgi:hypothetical protein